MMRTDRRSLAALLRLLRGHLVRITEEADGNARAAGLTVEVLGHWRRRYHDPRFDSRLTRGIGPYAEVRSEPADQATSWSAPTLVPAGWSG
jgi:hypothetical protein